MDPRAALKKWRGDRSYREAGELLGLDPSYVRYVENGERTPSELETAIAFRDVVGIPVDAWLQDKKKSSGVSRQQAKP
jgi:transcriptional regulator with XRE-family HTH domain